MSRSELHDWECIIENLSGDNADKMLAIAQDIYNTAFVRGKNYMSFFVTEDYISRQTVLDILKDKWNMFSDANDAMQKSIDTIEALTLATPQPKTGEWLEREVIDDKVIKEWQSARCSVCDKYHTTPYMYYFSRYNYCPNCGAKMGVEET